MRNAWLAGVMLLGCSSHENDRPWFDTPDGQYFAEWQSASCSGSADIEVAYLSGGDLVVCARPSTAWAVHASPSCGIIKADNGCYRRLQVIAPTASNPYWCHRFATEGCSDGNTSIVFTSYDNSAGTSGDSCTFVDSGNVCSSSFRPLRPMG